MHTRYPQPMDIALIIPALLVFALLMTCATATMATLAPLANFPMIIMTMVMTFKHHLHHTGNYLILPLSTLHHINIEQWRRWRGIIIVRFCFLFGVRPRFHWLFRSVHSDHHIGGGVDKKEISAIISLFPRCHSLTFPFLIPFSTQILSFVLYCLFFNLNKCMKV